MGIRLRPFKMKPTREVKPPEPKPKQKRILYLTLKREWFDLIARGEKKIEYRDNTPYWSARLNKEYDEIHFRNGYIKTAPFMRVEWLGCELKEQYEIKLGKVLETQNWKG